MKSFVLIAVRPIRGIAWILLLAFLAFIIGGLITYPLYKVQANSTPIGLQLVLLIAWLGLLVAAIWAVSDEDRRTRFLSSVMRDGHYGWMTPLLLTIVILLLTAAGFSLLTTVLLEKGLVHLTDPSCSDPCALGFGDFVNFYLWHVFEGIPIIRINQTLHWDEPLVYQGALTGWLIVGLKLAIIYPLVLTLRTYWKLRSKLPRVRIDARPRIVHVGSEVRVSWASASREGYVFDVYSIGPPNSDSAGYWKRSGPTLPAWAPESGWIPWKVGTTETEDVFVPRRSGTYRFQARWRTEAEPKDEASNTPLDVKVVVKGAHANSR